MMWGRARTPCHCYNPGLSRQDVWEVVEGVMKGLLDALQACSLQAGIAPAWRRDLCQPRAEPKSCRPG